LISLDILTGEERDKDMFRHRNRYKDKYSDRQTIIDIQANEGK